MNNSLIAAHTSGIILMMDAFETLKNTDNSLYDIPEERYTRVIYNFTLAGIASLISVSSR